MDFFIHFAYPWILYVLLPLIVALTAYRLRSYKPLVYRYSLTTLLHDTLYDVRGNFNNCLVLLRVLMLVGLALVLAKPRIVDFQSKIQGEGVDMMLVLDVSNSMQQNDDPHDERSRLDVAKQEAIKFIDKREHDPIGLVIFGLDAVSRCPLTLDKNILKEIIKDTTLGTIDGRGTLLNSGMIIAANRLKDSKGSSKVMIVLTDGVPHQDPKTDEQAIAVAKKFGIKIYTIGIGPDGHIPIRGMFGMVQYIQGMDKGLLKKIADQTGGKFFEAKKPEDMKEIYNTIDALEKTDYETNIFTHYYDVFKPFLIGASILALLEIIASSFVWFTV